jgi:hypothetical protein
MSIKSIGEQVLGGTMNNEPVLPGSYHYVDGMLDITAPDIVEVEFREDGKVIWVNVDGKCALRVCQIKQLFVTDSRD